ncbi:MAG TPA: diguanylate cyclase [Solirubrobacterales bacterium]|nr:diguanylate cyclase [Solirubrobacterales bacterium]
MFEGANTGTGAGAAAIDPGYGQRSDSREVAPLARAGAYVSLAGMGLGILGVLLPHPDYFDVQSMLLVQASTGLFAAFFLIFANRVPMWLVRLTPAMGILQVTAGVYFTNDPTSAFSLFYLWPCFYAFYFLPRIDAVADVIFLGLCYGGAMVVMAGSDHAVETEPGVLTYQFVVTVGSLAVAGLMLHALRTRVNRLWGSLSSAARTDLLTGFVNSHGINEILTNEIERARINTQRVGLVAVHLSGLRQLNKEFGYEAGDEVLRQLARMLDESTRRIDTVGRTGASEFVIALPQTDEHTGFLLAEQILTRMRRAYRERGFNLSASLGVAVFPKHASNVDELLQATTAATNAAMALGSDRVVVYSPDLEGAIEGEGVSMPGEGRAQLGTVLSLAEVLDLRDEDNASHSTAVAGYCEMIGRDMGLSDQRIQRLRLAGMLHDIGKVGIPDSILDKPGPLSPSEWDQVRRHPEMAARILAARELTDIREWVLARHEQPDGHGYPRGLAEEEIPLESRILAVAESYDAMTSERPYRAAMSSDEAIAEMGRYAGSQFDGAVVDALVRALDRATAGSAV